MAINEYIVSIMTAKPVKFKLSYKNSIFHKVELLTKCSLGENQYKSLFKLFPHSEGMIKDLILEYESRVSWERVEKNATLHEMFMEEYCLWYELRFDIKPIIKPSDASALKFIKNAITKLSTTDAEAMDVWQMILLNWSNLDKWYQTQTDLPQIKRNLNVILKTLKHGKFTQQESRKAKDVSNDYREKFKNGDN